MCLRSCRSSFLSEVVGVPRNRTPVLQEATRAAGVHQYCCVQFAQGTNRGQRISRGDSPRERSLHGTHCLKPQKNNPCFDTTSITIHNHITTPPSIKNHKNTFFYIVFGFFRSPRPYDHME